MNIKVISFNVRCCDDKDGNSIQERAPRLLTVMNPYEADVIGFQEYTPMWNEYVEKNFGDKYEIFNRYRTDDVWSEGTPILWKKDKFECLERGCFWLSDTPEIVSGGWDDYGCNRVCLYALLKDKSTGAKFAFFNTHLGFGDENQVKSVRLICENMQKFEGYSAFLTGDFNMTPASLAYGASTESLSDANVLTVNDKRSTYHGYAPENNKDSHIDYCFTNANTKPTSFKIIDELVENKFPSDHYGIYAELEIK